MNQYIEQAVESFRTLITEQLARQERMEAGEAAKDFANLPHLTIGICGGDGIGPIITHAGEDVLRFLLAEDVAAGRVEFRDIDGLTIECSPHTGSMVAGGLRFPEVVYLLGKIVDSGRKIVGFDLTEVVPDFADKTDAAIASRLLYNMCAMALKNHPSEDVL